MSNEQSVPLVLALDDTAAALEQVGGKGASLAQLAAVGLPVPPGFHITTAAYRYFVRENGLQEQILATVSAVTADQPTSLEEASSKIGRMFAQGSMPAEIATAIRQAYVALGGDDLSVAVRSSATAEDLPDLSFAGQQETYLNMRGEAMVLDAIKRCWASLWTARAIGYRARAGIAHEEVSLAVVVQELVLADAAGILFTANPLTGERDQVMINATWGLGEAIVSGQITPDTVVVDRASGTIIAQQISEKEVMTVCSQSGTSEEPVPVGKRTSAVLTAVQAAQLARIGVRIEELYGQPMDIEWALRQNRFFIVQARPITTLSKTAGSQVRRPPVDETLWSAFCQRFTAHLAQFGHAIYDLDFSKPVPADDPVALLETLKFFLSSNAPDPYARQATSKKAREHAMQTMLNRLRGPSRWLFRRLVGMAQRFAPLREDELADVGLGWPVLRRMLREIGQRLVTHDAITIPDDVFWLTQDELLEAVIALDRGQSPANYHTTVSERRTTWESERMLTPPIALPLKGGTRSLGMNFSSILPARTGQQAGDVLKGSAASPGHVTGMARVIHGADEFAQMRQGDILVARITTPAWTPLFALAAGIVTDVGGPLSHSSIVAREYRIPAVLGTGVATERLHTGQNVTVDGDAGTVTLSR
ncbi:MAG TPA: PEP/pyruvate-binding domain-containing protein [Ktedonobacteraceae bacterium]|nr:PEP/pyruvate-binding domain-containing protein [Ktedonobacteraceae bacterium]